MSQALDVQSSNHQILLPLNAIHANNDIGLYSTHSTWVDDINVAVGGDNCSTSNDIFQTATLTTSNLPRLNVAPLKTQYFVDIVPILFSRNVADWKANKGATSSITAMAMLPAYQRIIGMGQAAVPLILAQLRSEGDQPDMWFWALKAITGVDPILDDNRGNFISMAADWLQWGQQNDVS